MCPFVCVLCWRLGRIMGSLKLELFLSLVPLCSYVVIYFVTTGPSFAALFCSHVLFVPALVLAHVCTCRGAFPCWCIPSCNCSLACLVAYPRTCGICLTLSRLSVNLTFLYDLLFISCHVSYPTVVPSDVPIPNCCKRCIFDFLCSFSRFFLYCVEHHGMKCSM